MLVIQAVVRHYTDWATPAPLFSITQTKSCNKFYRTVPLGKTENSGESEEDNVVSLLRQLPASQHEQDGSTADMPSSNKASDATSDSSDEKQAPSAMIEVSVLKVFLVCETVHSLDSVQKWSVIFITDILSYSKFIYTMYIQIQADTVC
jgi:hypothetical protein